MSEFQKWVASICGAVIGQIAVFAFFYLLVINPGMPELVAKSASPEPKEVTVMLSQLVEPTPPVPEIKPEMLPEPVAEEPPGPEEKNSPFERQFIDTDGNTASSEEPEDARFESDKNTTASTEFLPDPNQPAEAGPTMKGEEILENLSLRDQEYFDGEIRDQASPPPSAMSPADQPPNPVEVTTPADEEMDTAPSETTETSEQPATPADEVSEAEKQENTPGEADTPPETNAAENLVQPDTEVIGEEAQMAVTEKSFTDPSQSASALKLPAEQGEEDLEAIATEMTEETGEPETPEQKSEIKASPVETGQAEDRLKKFLPTASPSEIQRQMDESMFDPAFLAQRRKNSQNGDITTLGEGSVNAISTEVAKYKKAVNQAIGRKWHQYRIDAGDHVTWGLLKVRFNVTPEGNVRNLSVEKKEATELVTEFSLKAIVNAKIPAMPDEVASQLGSRGLEMHYNIVIY